MQSWFAWWVSSCTSLQWPGQTEVAHDGNVTIHHSCDLIDGVATSNGELHAVLQLREERLDGLWKSHGVAMRVRFSTNS